MPPPIKVELLLHDPQWAEQATAEGQALIAAIGPCVLAVHHVGSTAIPRIRTKPVLDLIPVVSSLSDLDQHRGELERLGYAWWGELGLPGRRYCTKTDPGSMRRLVQLHCYAEGSPEVVRHLAFRDYLRQNADVAPAYDQEKARCRRLYPNDSHAYGDCKDAWIREVETRALVALKNQ
ncbi:hypothetical protein UB46_17970 [Burkholderiaceae bacterium 16]|nr:hypothetical protein UB46_17970 [Burkholderiaceae bacterium 16]